jgi:hypothetical protein
LFQFVLHAYSTPTAASSLEPGSSSAHAFAAAFSFHQLISTNLLTHVFSEMPRKISQESFCWHNVCGVSRDG